MATVSPLFSWFSVLIVLQEKLINTYGLSPCKGLITGFLLLKKKNSTSHLKLLDDFLFIGYYFICQYFSSIIMASMQLNDSLPNNKTNENLRP